MPNINDTKTVSKTPYMILVNGGLIQILYKNEPC